MHLPNKKLLLASCCDRLLARNGLTAVASQRLFACSGSRSFSLPKLSSNRQQSSQLVTFNSSEFGKFSCGKLGEFEPFRRESDTLGRHGSAANCKLSQLQNGDKLNLRLLADPGDNKQYRRCLMVNSTDYHCKRHYSRHLNSKRQFVIHSAAEKEYDSQKDKQIDEPVSVTNNSRYSTIEPSKIERTPQPSTNEPERRDVKNSHYTADPYNSSYSSNTRLKLNATLSHRSDQAIGLSINKPSTHLVFSFPSNQQTAGSSIDSQPTDQFASSSQQQPATSQQDFSDLINVRSIYRNNLLNQSDQGDLKKMSGVPFKPKKALILTKFSRLEYERRRLADYTEEEVKDSVSLLQFVQVCLSAQVCNGHSIVSRKLINLSSFFRHTVDKARFRLREFAEPPQHPHEEQGACNKDPERVRYRASHRESIRVQPGADRLGRCNRNNRWRRYLPDGG